MEPRACLCTVFQWLLLFLQELSLLSPLLLPPGRQAGCARVQVVAMEPFLSKDTEPTGFVSSLLTVSTYSPFVFLTRNLTDSSTKQL